VPFDQRIIPEVEALGSIPRAILAVSLLLAAAYGAGRIVAGPTRGPRSGLDAALLQIAVGLSLVGAIGVTLGQMQWLAGSRSIWLLGGLSLLALPPLMRCWRFPAFQYTSPIGKLRQLWWFSLPLALALVTLGPALCYPSGWDELVYHSELPRRWLAVGSPSFYPDLPYSGFPSLGEILFWLMAPIEVVIAPRLLVWVCWVIGLVLLQRLLRQSLRSSAACMLTFAFALSPATLLISANCYVESILMMQLAALLVAFGRPRRRAGTALCWAPSAVIGVLAGGAAAVKLTGLAILAVPCLWYFGVTWRDRFHTQPAVKNLGVCLMAAICVALPFYVRPWLATGNPFYPYFGEWFTADPARLELSRYHHAIGGAAFGVRSVAAFLTGPLLLSFAEKNYDGSFGWQLLGFVLLAAVAVVNAWRSRRRWLIWWPAAVWLWLYTFWYLTAQQARFAVPAMLVLVALAGLGLHPIRGKLRNLLLIALVTAAVVSAPWRTAGYYLGSWLAVLGAFSATQQLDEGTDFRYVPLLQAIAERVPADGKVMLLFEHRGFYVPRNCAIGTPGFQESGFTPPESYADPQAFMARLEREGITHLAMTKGPSGPDWLPQWQVRLEPLLRSIEACSREDRLRVVWESEHYYLLEVSRPP
jgi:hypothetical protein